MPVQVWGTYSVSDHLDERPFVADVLLYDRLVIPVPASDAERDLWRKADWEPEKLERLVAVLADGAVKRRRSWWRRRAPRQPTDLVRSVKWDASRREAFETEWKLEKEQARRHVRRGLTWQANPMAATRALLFDEAAEQRDRDFFRSHPDVVAECVAAYPSWKRFDREELTPSTIESEPASHASAVPTQQPELELSRVLGWELFVPDDDTRSDEDLLAAAVELAQRESFRTARMEFHEARQRLYAAGGDAKTLRADLEKRLGRYQEECAQGRIKQKTRYAFFVAGSSLSLLGLVVPPALPLIAGVLAGGAGILAEAKLPGGPHDAYSRPAAMLADARKHFGWEEA